MRDEVSSRLLNCAFSASFCQHLYFSLSPPLQALECSEPAGRVSANVGVARRLRRATSVASVGESQTSEVSFKVINSFEYQEDCFVRCSASHLHSLRSLRTTLRSVCLAPLTPSELARTKAVSWWDFDFLERSLSRAH